MITHEATLQIAEPHIAQDAPAQPHPEQQNVAETAPTVAPVPTAQIEQRPPRKYRLGRMVAAVAFVGCMVFGGDREAEAAPPDTVAVQAQSPNSSNWLKENLPLGISVLTSLVAVAALRRQGKDKKDDRFHAALQGLKGESTGEEREMRLHALAPYANSREYAPKVFHTAIAYLRGRRGGLEILRHSITDQHQLEHAIMERRNADRSAFNLFLATLPAARRQVRIQKILAFAKVVAGRKDALQTLDDLTGVRIDREKRRVNARAINLDDMRDVKRCNLANVDLTGAGLQRNQITSVVLKAARLCEAQFEGTTVSRCDLREADLRAAYFHGATFEKCVVDAKTKFGNLPDNHPDAKFGSLKPDQPDKYRGNPEVILKDLISDTLSPEQIIKLVRSWQQNGLKLLEGSNPEYFLHPV